jgi:hypothetical protein
LTPSGVNVTVSWKANPMREYELYVPLHYNDGRPIEPEKLTRLKRQLVEEFGGLTHFPQENEGLWKVGNYTFRDRIVIFRVLANDVGHAEIVFARLKEELCREWEQQDVLIIARKVSAL